MKCIRDGLMNVKPKMSVHGIFGHPIGETGRPSKDERPKHATNGLRCSCAKKKDEGISWVRLTKS
jgi:hypothetical protein